MEVLTPHLQCISVGDPTMVADARRRIAALGERLDFGETQAGRLSIVATELATNLVRHAGGGELFVVATETPDGPAIDLLSVDRGRGMADVDACLRDGFSTAGSAGTGLGAISRLASRFDLFSVVDRGTVVYVRVRPGAGARANEREPIDPFGLCLPHPGEEIPGDSWSTVVDGDIVHLLLVDGLGHGTSAADAAREAVAVFEASPVRTPHETLERIHLALRSTRGAVAGVAAIDLARRVVTYAGIGNIAAMVVAPSETKRLISHNGTLGARVRRIVPVESPFPPGAVLVATSDGIASQVDVAKYPGLVHHSAPVIAGTIMRDFRRGRDDATVVVVCEEAAR